MGSGGIIGQNGSSCLAVGLGITLTLSYLECTRAIFQQRCNQGSWAYLVANITALYAGILYLPHAVLPFTPCSTTGTWRSSTCTRRPSGTAPRSPAGRCTPTGPVTTAWRWPQPLRYPLTCLVRQGLCILILFRICTVESCILSHIQKSAASFFRRAPAALPCTAAASPYSCSQPLPLPTPSRSSP